MDDKVLIKSQKYDELLRVAIKGFAIAAVCSLILTFMTEKVRMHGVKSTFLGWHIMFWFDGFKSILAFLLFVGGSICLLTAIITGIGYLANYKCEICVTENNVKGKTRGGKEVVLPLSMISAYSTRKYLSTIAVATSSGIIKFCLIKNYKEIGDVLSKKINERNENSGSTKASEPKGNNMDDLLKLKSLLDAGVITQEEFEAKKKQLLGL